MNFEEKFQNMHLLDRDERSELTKKLQVLRPEFMRPFSPYWWWWSPCEVNVLIVCDGGLNFGTSGGGLSEFLTTFNELEAQSPVWINYKVTLGHRTAAVNSPNPVVVNHISNFKFDTSVNLEDFDQVWLFGINAGGSITNSEISAIEAYMNDGGGLFATGDHGALGNAMCGNIPRVRDMRYWDNTPAGSTNSTNEVSMSGRRRNDTNRPAAGASVSRSFDNQSDEIPQTIAVRTFGGGQPHPLLSISTSIRPSGIIDIMPDHPHEGECAPETTFTVNGAAVPTQIIATSFVLGGSTTANGAGKDLTDPHCFPSIAVWDGYEADVGRIVVDSTWHHFVNINLNGAGSARPGLTSSDFNVIRHYYMNIAKWMTRKKRMLCIRKRVIFELLKDSQIVEASLDNPDLPLNEIKIADLNSIGSLAEETLGSKINPAFARSFLLDLIQDLNEDLFKTLNPWAISDPEVENEANKVDKHYQHWLNLDLLVHTTIGAGFMALRENDELQGENIGEEVLEKIDGLFQEGMNYGLDLSLNSLLNEFENFNQRIK